jgi:hypothetical protein
MCKRPQVVVALIALACAAPVLACWRLQAVEHAPATPAVTTSPTQISGAGAAGQTTEPC